MIADLARGLRDLVYPNICVRCETLLTDSCEDFCPACVRLLTDDPHRTCPRCCSTIADFADISDGCILCREDRLHFDSVFRLGPYEGPLRDAILTMKHRAGENLAECLGQLWTRQQASRFLAIGADLVIPVPLHYWKRWRRGYNQSECLSAAVAIQLSVPHVPAALKRIRSTPSQVGLSAAQRRASLKGAFQADKPVQIAGRNILLIDDVMTTGSTASESAKALKKGGAATVHVAILAHQ